MRLLTAELNIHSIGLISIKTHRPRHICVSLLLLLMSTTSRSFHLPHSRLYHFVIRSIVPETCSLTASIARGLTWNVTRNFSGSAAHWTSSKYLIWPTILVTSSSFDLSLRYSRRASEAGAHPDLQGAKTGPTSQSSSPILTHDYSPERTRTAFHKNIRL